MLDCSVRLTVKHLFSSLAAGLNLSYTQLLMSMEMLSSKSRAVCSQLLKENRTNWCLYIRLHPSACSFLWQVLVKLFSLFTSYPHLPCMVCSLLLLPAQGGTTLHVGRIARTPHEWHFLMSFWKIIMDLWDGQLETEKSERDQKYFVLDLHGSDTEEVSIVCICQKIRTS